MQSSTHLSGTRLPNDLISVGHITGAFGVQGWIRIHPYSADASALLHAKTWWLVKVANKVENKSENKFGVGSEVPAKVPLDEIHDVEKLEAKRHGDEVVARMMGIVGRDAAESLKGFVVQVQRSHFPVLSDNEFYWQDLIGLAVENCQGESLGIVADLIDCGAHPILRVIQSKTELTPTTKTTTTAPAREYLIPFVDHFVPNVDQKNKKITVDWGLDY